MAWLDYIVYEFLGIADNAHEHAWFGAVNSLLQHLFPENQYIVHFEHPPTAHRRLRTDAVVKYRFQVLEEGQVIFVVEVKRKQNLSKFSAREEADTQIRDRLERYVVGTRLRKLWGISIFGDTFAPYFITKRGQNIHPAERSRRAYLTNTVPKKWWDYNIFTDKGEAKLRAIVAEVRSDIDRANRQG